MCKKRKTGSILISVSGFLFLVDRLSLLISTALGKLFCGDKYMMPVNGVLGDKSCGFNADMYLAVFLVIIMAFGIFLFMTAPDEESNKKHQSS
jgi:hypothetical protein